MSAGVDAAPEWSTVLPIGRLDRHSALAHVEGPAVVAGPDLVPLDAVRLVLWCGARDGVVHEGGPRPLSRAALQQHAAQLGASAALADLYAEGVLSDVAGAAPGDPPWSHRYRLVPQVSRWPSAVLAGSVLGVLPPGVLGGTVLDPVAADVALREVWAWSAWEPSLLAACDRAAAELAGPTADQVLATTLLVLPALLRAQVAHLDTRLAQRGSREDGR